MPRRKSITFIIDENGCHICTSHCRDWDGYPILTSNKITKHMHRVLYEEAFGPIDPELVVRHTCDNTSCINLDHMVLGTWKQNAEDRASRNRSYRPLGTLNKQSKLTPELVIEIRNATGSQEKVAVKYGIDPSSVSRIKNGLRWGHLKK